KRAEDELRRSEKSLHEAQTLSETGRWKWNAVSGASIVSPEMGRMFRVNPDDDALTIQYFINWIHPEDRQRVQELFEHSVAQKKDFEADYRIVLTDGAIRHHRTVGHAIVNESGELAEFVGTTVDDTDQWRAKLELERALEELRRSEKSLHE